MKSKISISIDKETAERLESVALEQGFRNRSHLVETALDVFLKGVGNEEGKRTV